MIRILLGLIKGGIVGVAVGVSVAVGVAVETMHRLSTQTCPDGQSLFVTHGSGVGVRVGVNVLVDVAVAFGPMKASITSLLSPVTKSEAREAKATKLPS